MNFAGGSVGRLTKTRTLYAPTNLRRFFSACALAWWINRQKNRYSTSYLIASRLRRSSRLLVAIANCYFMIICFSAICKIATSCMATISYPSNLKVVVLKIANATASVQFFAVLRRTIRDLFGKNYITRTKK
jgi:hypothetical protein